MKKNYLAVCMVGATALSLETAAKADVIFNNARTTGNQWGYDVGMDFTVNSAVSVTALGTFDANISTLTDPVTTAQINASLQQGESSGNYPIIHVGIFNVATGTEVSPTANFFYNDPNIANYYAIAGSIFQNITPFILGPGVYSIVATGYTVNLASGIILNFPNPPTPTFNTLLGALSFPSTGYARSNGNGVGAPPLAFPTDFSTIETSPDFLAGTFIAVHGVPDCGSTAALLGFAFVGLGTLRRKLKS
jgi:hypothetical protein